MTYYNILSKIYKEYFFERGMDCFLKKIANMNGKETRKYFVRFGKGDYKKRFLLSFQKGKKLKLQGSFEWANDFVKFAKENKEVKFTGKILTKEKVGGMNGRKKAGCFVYEISDSSLKEFENAYYSLVDANDSEIILKIKKSLPKPGKREDKIDGKFCSMELNEKFLEKIREAFLWDVPDCKNAKIEHEIKITDIEFSLGEKDAEIIRETAVRKGKIIRKINCDGRQIVKEYALDV